jgi:hypothetical protein
VADATAAGRAVWTLAEAAWAVGAIPAHRATRLAVLAAVRTAVTAPRADLDIDDS